MFLSQNKYNFQKKQGLAVNPARFTDYCQGVQVETGAMVSTIDMVENAFDGVDGADETDGQNLVRECFATMFEREAEQSTSPTAWASNALEIAQSIPEFDVLKSYTEGDADMSSVAVNEILSSIIDQVAEMRQVQVEEEQEQNDDGEGQDGQGQGEQGQGQGQGQSSDADSDGENGGDSQGSGSGEGQGQDPNEGIVEDEEEGAEEQGSSASDNMTQEQIDNMRIALRSAISKAVEDVKEMKECLVGAGDERGAGHKEMVDRSKLIAKLKRNSRVANILKQAGRIQRMPSAKPSMAKENGHTPCGVEMTDSIANMIGSEFSNFANDDLELLMFQRMTEKKLFGIKRKGKQPLGRGPAVFCIDESGSMSGHRNNMARALGTAMIQLMAKDKRSSTVIGYDTGINNVHEFNGKYRTARRNGQQCSWNDAIIDMASVCADGGTNFDPALRKALEVIGKEKRADLIFLTDGDASVSRSVLRKLDLAKKNGMRVTTILIGGGRSKAVEAISDTVHRVQDLTADLGAQIIGDARTKVQP